MKLSKEHHSLGVGELRTRYLLITVSEADLGSNTKPNTNPGHLIIRCVLYLCASMPSSALHLIIHIYCVSAKLCNFYFSFQLTRVDSVTSQRFLSIIFK